MGIAVEVGLGTGEVALPAWVNGTASHTWSPRLGGTYWYQRTQIVDLVAGVIDELSRPVLIRLCGPWYDVGYRFDLNSWDSSTEEASWWPGDEANHEYVMQTLGETYAEYFWSMPCPVTTTTLAGDGPCTGGNGFVWQKANYYAAYLQYLIEPVSMTPEQYNALNSTYDCFTDGNCTTWNTTSETAVGGNWGNLRAKRGHPDPYPILWVILGVEPYGSAQENLTTGETYGIKAEAFRTAIRARGGELSTIPLGLHWDQVGAASDFEREWLSGMLDNCTYTDFAYFDCYHLYALALNADWPREFPQAVCTDLTSPRVSPGWENHWISQGSWVSDFSKYLWQFEDLRKAIDLYGDDQDRWEWGASEHGVLISSPWSYNDMRAALHWAQWYQEIARYGNSWDSIFVLMEQGYTHAYLQAYNYSPGGWKIVRTPGFYVLQMVMRLYGCDYLPNTYTSAYYTTNTGYAGFAYRSDSCTVRVFRRASDGHVFIFGVNKHISNTATISGFEAAIPIHWWQLTSDNLTDENHYSGNPYEAETIYTSDVVGSHTPGNAFVLPSISINLIEVG